MTGVPNGKPEQRTFIGDSVKYSESEKGLCRRPCTRYCCISTGVLGGFLLLLGLVLLAGGQGMLEGMVARSMAFSEGSSRLHSWLYPPVDSALVGYGWNITNPDEVLKGEKPVLQEIGPYVYKAIYIKDSIDQETRKEHIAFNDDGETLTYSPRRFYFLDLEKSVSDPREDLITAPNVPFLSVLHKVRKEGDYAKAVARELAMQNGAASPFITVSFHGLLWGYNDDLPCVMLTRPNECGLKKGDIDIFGSDDEEEEADLEWDSWKRKKRSADRYKREVNEAASSVDVDPNDLKDLDFDAITLPKAEFVDCECEWGLFRDRNVTLRKAMKIKHGQKDLSQKGLTVEFDNSPVLNWWKPGSQCDAVGGADSGTLPPGIQQTQAVNIFISLMCRKLELQYEQDKDYSGLKALRYVPPANALGSHDDPDDNMRNEANECYCLKEEGFECYKSGVLDMGPCKRSETLPKGPPMALSYPHFYLSDPSFREAVVGMKPDKEKHQFYADIEPTLGVPLAIRPRFQLNAVLRRDPNIPVMSELVEELVLPFLWAEDGFGGPSEEFEAAVSFGVSAPRKLSLLGGGLLLVLGGLMLASALGWVVWARRQEGGRGESKQNGAVAAS